MDSSRCTLFPGITTPGKYRDLAAERETSAVIIFALIGGAYLVALIMCFLIAEQLGKRAVVYAIASGYGVMLILQPTGIFFIFFIVAGLLSGISIGAYIERRDMKRISGINLHDKVRIYGDLKTAESKASRVAMQKAEAKQARLIENALDDQRPIALPGEPLEAYGNGGREQSYGLSSIGRRFQVGVRPLSHVGFAESMSQCRMSDLRSPGYTVSVSHVRFAESCRICGVRHAGLPQCHFGCTGASTGVIHDSGQKVVQCW